MAFGRRRKTNGSRATSRREVNLQQALAAIYELFQRKVPEEAFDNCEPQLQSLLDDARDLADPLFPPPVEQPSIPDSNVYGAVPKKEDSGLISAVLPEDPLLTSIPFPNLQLSTGEDVVGQIDFRSQMNFGGSFPLDAELPPIDGQLRVPLGKSLIHL